MNILGITPISHPVFRILQIPQVSLSAAGASSYWHNLFMTELTNFVLLVQRWRFFEEAAERSVQIQETTGNINWSDEMLLRLSSFGLVNTSYFTPGTSTGLSFSYRSYNKYQIYNTWCVFNTFLTLTPCVSSFLDNVTVLSDYQSHFGWALITIGNWKVRPWEHGDLRCVTHAGLPCLFLHSQQGWKGPGGELGGGGVVAGSWMDVSAPSDSASFSGAAGTKAGW